MSEREVRLATGEVAVVAAFDGENLQLECAAPLPPGSRVTATTSGNVTLRGKVTDARRAAEPGRFRVTLKLSDLPRSARESLLEIARGRSGAAG